MLIDTHCHLDFDRFDHERDQVVIRANKAGVSQIVVPAINLDNFQAVIDLTLKYPGVFAAIGVHPNSAADWEDDWLKKIKDSAQNDKVVAIGEIGLDYHWDLAPKDTQHRALQAQLDLAVELKLPVIIHNRESSNDLIKILNASPIKDRPNPGVLHSFSASLDTAEKALEMGFYLGFTGPITFKKADELRDIAKHVPLNRILVETDAPFLAPQSHRGKRNEPAFVTTIAEKLAELHGLEFSEMALISSQNAMNLFGKRIANTE